MRGPGRPPTPMTKKLRVLSMYERTNIDAPTIALLMGCSERAVRRWIADARRFLDELEAAQQ